jgi:hypothetical protein
MAMVRYVSFAWNLWPLAPLPLELALSAVLGNFFVWSVLSVSNFGLSTLLMLLGFSVPFVCYVAFMQAIFSTDHARFCG